MKKNIFLIVFNLMFATGVLAQGVTVQSGDLKFDLQGYGQANYNVKNTDDETTNKFELTRVILMPNLQLTPKLNLFAMIDIASKSSDKYMHEYWGQYRFCDAFKVKFGQGKIPFSIENPLAPIAVGNIFFHEGLAYLAGIGGDASYGNFVGRDFGLSVGGDLFKSDKGYHHLSYSVGVFNGSGMNQAENNNQKDFAAKIDYKPCRNLTFSTSTYLGTGYAIADDQYGQFCKDDDYKRQRWAIGVEVNTNQFYLRSEYLRGWNEGTPSQSAYAEAWLKLIKLKKQKQSIDLVLDYEYFDRNILQKNLTRNYLVGVQWWLYKMCRLSSLFQYKDSPDGNNSRCWVTQLQLVF